MKKKNKTLLEVELRLEEMARQEENLCNEKDHVILMLNQKVSQLENQIVKK